MLRRLLPQDNLRTAVRQVSSKYQKPKPRSYKRRWFEAAVQPVFPQELKSCTPPALLHQRNVENSRQYMDFEVALAQHVKNWMQREQFRVLVVCQQLPVPGRTLWFAKNQWRLKGIEHKVYGSKIMRKVFEGTPLDSLDIAFAGSTSYLFGKDFSTLKHVVAETEKLNWIVPLLYFADGKILSAADVKELAQLADLEHVRAQTVSILTQPASSLTNTFDRVARQTTFTLDSYEHALKTE
ncbi:unnamed protein product, partial [Mesorhabditis spiculigera]